MREALPFLFAHNDENMTCSNAPKGAPFQKQIRGVNGGGWLVLEPCALARRAHNATARRQSRPLPLARTRSRALPL